MKNNITLIGMPGSGKSTTGVILAKALSFGFLDTDILIQQSERKTLQEILDETGHLNLRSIEEKEILKVHPEKYVIATGGSAVYSKIAMEHLSSISSIVFLKADLAIIEQRIKNFNQRGIAKALDQTFKELFFERQPLYEKYAEILIDCNAISQEEAAEMIAEKYAVRHPEWII